MRRSILFLVCGVLVAAPPLALPFAADAESVVWSALQPDLIMRTESGASTNPSLYLLDPIVQINYSIAVSKVDQNGAKIETLQSGASVPIGTHVLFEFVPHEYTDVYWTGTGGSWGTPYGEWSTTGATPSWTGRCSSNNLYFSGVNPNLSDYYGRTITAHLFAALSVREPGKNVAVQGGAFSCSASGAFNKLCVATAAGTADTQFTFQPTTGEFYPGQYFTGGAPLKLAQPSGSNDCSANSMEWGSGSMVRWSGAGKSTSGDYTLQVPAQSVPFSLTVEDDNTGSPPATPTPNSSAACVVGAPHAITMSATDPDNDNIRYGVDWNADGTVDEFVPPSGYVPSGTSQNASRTYSTAGEKTVKAMAQDEGGHSSGWSTISFNCTDAPEEDEDDQCQPVYSCVEGGVYNSCTDTVTPCVPGFFCSAGACVPEDGGGEQLSADITVKPFPVRQGDSTQVSWAASGASSCAVSEDNPDINDSWSGASGSQASSPLTQRTRYILSCIAADDSTITDSATVNVNPIYDEF